MPKSSLIPKNAISLKDLIDENAPKNKKSNIEDKIERGLVLFSYACKKKRHNNCFALKCECHCHY